VAAAARGTSRTGPGGVEIKSAPEDIFFRASKGMVARRNALSAKLIKKLARRPTKSFS
jgi:ribosomal protein L13